MPTGYQIKEQDQAYYLTLRVVNWVDIFSRKVYRDIIIENLAYCQRNKGLEIFAYVIMSNHIHLLVRSSRDELSNTIRDFKSYTAKEIFYQIETGEESRREWMMKVFQIAASSHKRNAGRQLWAHDNHAMHVYSEKFTKQKVNYIHQNPVRAGIVNNPEDYIYSSASNYAGETGILNVIVLSFGWETI